MERKEAVERKELAERNAMVEIQRAAPDPRAPTIAVAPAWHTAVLVLGILGVSIQQAVHFSEPHGAVNRLATYGLTATMELGVFGWILLGLRLGNTSLASLLGSFSLNIRSIARDAGIALLFWFASLVVLGSLAIAWTGAEAALTHRPTLMSNSQSLAPSPAQQQTLQTLSELAPANGMEVVAWTLLCLLAGFSEEIAFRGYLQRQFIASTRGRVVAGVLLSALCFGLAHGYEGARGIFLISAFGILFSTLALYRRSLRPGMMAHAWQDLLAGFALALLKSHHVI